jgi:hypothetical protein
MEMIAEGHPSISDSSNHVTNRDDIASLEIV